MRRKWTAIGMTILVMLGVSGCMNNHEKNIEEMLEHMQEKYGVEFEMQSYVPRNVDCSYDVWLCNAKGDEELIEVHRYYGKLAEDGKYADEYYSRLVQDEVERRAQEALLQVTDEAKAYLSAYKFAAEEYTEVEQLDEYLQTKSGNVSVGLLIFIQDKEVEGIKNQDVIDKMEVILRDAGIGNAGVRVVFVKNKELMDELSKENWREMLYRNGEKTIYTCNYGGRVNGELEQ